MAYIRCSEQIHRAVKREAADTGMSMQELAGEAWAAYERERTGLSARPNAVESITNQEQSTDNESTYTREQIQAIASEIRDRVEELLRITERVKVPEVAANTPVPAPEKKKMVTTEDYSERIGRVIADTAGIPDSIERIKEQLGGAGRDRKRSDRKISGG